MLKIDQIIKEDFSFREIMLDRINEDFNNVKSYSLEFRFMELTLAVKSIMNFGMSSLVGSIY